MKLMNVLVIVLVCFASSGCAVGLNANEQINEDGKTRISVQKKGKSALGFLGQFDTRLPNDDRDTPEDEERAARNGAGSNGSGNSCTSTWTEAVRIACRWKKAGTRTRVTYRASNCRLYHVWHTC